MLLNMTELVCFYPGYHEELPNVLHGHGYWKTMLWNLRLPDLRSLYRLDVNHLLHGFWILFFEICLYLLTAVVIGLSGLALPIFLGINAMRFYSWEPYLLGIKLGMVWSFQVVQGTSEMEYYCLLLVLLQSFKALHSLSPLSITDLVYTCGLCLLCMFKWESYTNVIFVCNV